MRNNSWRETVFALFLLGTISAGSLWSQSVTILKNFNGRNGFEPNGVPLIQGFDGSLYGATGGGGGSDSCPPSNGCGTIFRVAPDGKVHTMVIFNGTDGSYPIGLALGASGALYGVTSGGGLNSCNGNSCGTVFQMTQRGEMTTLYTFCSKANCADGYDPDAGLVQGAGGDFYGTTLAGGAHETGTVFKITPSGKLTTLYAFCALSQCLDGASPETSLIRGIDGDLYGTTTGGGGAGDGTVFKITPTGRLTTLHSFGGTDGRVPGGLVQTANGYLYGVAIFGGTASCPTFLGCGTIFEITPDGVFTTIFNFSGANGLGPRGAMVQATNGNLFGTTTQGGSESSTCAPPYGCGTLFEITPSGTLTTLYSFGGNDGKVLTSALVQATDGAFYGTAIQGGRYNDGTVFRLSVGFDPFVKPLPKSGAVGAVVTILGTGLAGTTSITFNSTPVTSFTVNATGSAITTTVPAGATTGPIQVNTSSGTLASNVPFLVRP